MHKTASHEPILECKMLTKDFGDGRGIFNVNLTLERGQVMGFVGPNGAGKSTTINILTGLTKPDKGTVKAFGIPYDSKSFYKLAPRIGVMYSEQTLDDHMTPQAVFMQSQEILGKDCQQRWQTMSTTLELDLHRSIKSLSLGNKKKVGIIHALMHQPELIIMDEPTSGLDPIIRERFAELVRGAVNEGASVLLSSHDLAEVQEMSDRVVMIKAGNIVLDNQTDKIINLAQRTFQLIKPTDTLVSTIEALPGISHVTKSATMFNFQTNDYEQAVRVITDANFYNFYIEKPDLEDSFKEFYE
jgi:ABC-2 type transport system ATP-binding protein